MDTDMVRGADADEVLAELRHRQPSPVSRTISVDDAVGRLVAGIASRSPRIYAPAWVRVVQWLPRGLLPAVLVRLGPTEAARLAGRLDATADARLLPVGPGGRAGSAAARSSQGQPR